MPRPSFFISMSFESMAVTISMSKCRSMALRSMNSVDPGLESNSSLTFSSVEATRTYSRYFGHEPDAGVDPGADHDDDHEDAEECHAPLSVLHMLPPYRIPVPMRSQSRIEPGSGLNDSQIASALPIRFSAGT